MIGSSTSLTPSKPQNQSLLSRSLLAPGSKGPNPQPEGKKVPYGIPGMNPGARPGPTPFPKPGPTTGGAGSIGGQSTMQKPQYIDINTTEDAVNNVLAKGYQEGDQRYQLKQTDKAGLSRGKGNQYMAQQEGVQAMTKAASEAAGVRAEDDKNNAKMRADYEKMRELEAMNYAMSQHSMNQSNWSQQFAQQQNMLDLFKALMSR